MNERGRSLDDDRPVSRSGIPAHPRFVAIIATVLLHLAMLALLITAGTIRPLPRAPASAITLTLPQAASDAGARTVAAPRDSKPSLLPPLTRPLPSQVPLPLPPEPEPVDVGALTPQFDTEPDPAVTGDVVSLTSGNANANGADAGCGLAESVRDALEQSVEARSALARIPRSSRSVANALMIWDGEWIAAERLGGLAALSSVRKAIAGVVDRASADCGSRAETGPVFLIVRHASETIVLALGSGAWRWSDLSMQSPSNAD